jgi:adiponectin receptor
MSIAYHLFVPINANIANFWRKLDIGFMYIGGIFKTISFSYYVFSLQYFMLLNCIVSIISICGLCHVILLPSGKPLNPFFQSATVGLLFFLYYIPSFYVFCMNVFNGKWTNSSTAAILHIMSLFVGGCIYAHGVPEKWAPGKFDFVGSSHNIMHIFVIISSFAECLFLFDQFNCVTKI